MMLEECGWKEQLRQDCLQYAREHSTASASSSATNPSSNGKRIETENVAPTFKDMTLESLLGSLQDKAKGPYSPILRFLSQFYWQNHAH